ncbi:SUKH-3 domain-containing protein [Streptomyces sp. B-S-A8]|uniref:SUKH-3 domain-containing protein n=1 Tax=Streptomyces solicavernae TaxID=3043614 RepID=A0ABT6RP74_9ACTN|nr:SUKH-3 domain-containing protein [Streptomyces sp. B-S-A8]MDI3386209.1 SUKH-3 domain-containing protein [Streptomyces sp. B-S-A8]
MKAQFSPDVADVLSAFGWSPERSVDPTPWTSPFEENGIPAHQEVTNFLTQFGGLNIKVSGPGINCAREPFELDPLLCLGEEDRFSEWGEELGVQLFPIGELDEGRFFLGMDERGAVYLVADWIARFGPWPEAIDALVRGVAPEEIST